MCTQRADLAKSRLKREVGREPIERVLPRQILILPYLMSVRTCGNPYYESHLVTDATLRRLASILPIFVVELLVILLTPVIIYKV